MDTRFHCVYLLRSLDPQCVGEYYIGYTVNPIRRLRQHNGELVNGAWRTKRRGRPWELFCCVSGFGEDRIALKFEWCWQHPTKSTRLKTHMIQLRGVHRLPYAIGVMHFLLRADLFARLQLTLHVFESAQLEQITAELRQRVPGLPELTETSLLHIEEITKERFQSQYLDEADKGEDCVYFLTAPMNCSQAYVDNSAKQQTEGKRYLCEEDILRQHAREKELLEAGQYPCSLCTLPLRAPYFMRCSKTPFCGLRTHLTCLAMWFIFDTIRQKQLEVKSSFKRKGDGRRHNTVDDSSGRLFEVTSEGHHVSGQIGNELLFHSSNCYVLSPSPPPPPSSPSPSRQQQQQRKNEEGGGGSGELFPSLTLLPRLPCTCPLCDEPLQWGALVHDLKRRAVLERRWWERQRREKMEAALAERLRRMQSISLAERQRQKKTTRAGQKRRRGGGGNNNNSEGSAVGMQQGDSLDCSFFNNAHESSALFSVVPSEEDVSTATSAAGYRVNNGQVTDMTEMTGKNSITDICDSVLQLTEFNLEEWLNV